MATATKKAAKKRKPSSTKTAAKKSAVKRGTTKKAASKKTGSKKGSTKKNKLGVKNSLVNNINKHKEKGDSKSKKKSSVDKESYKKMENNWGKEK
jgi:hypothetical protein